MKKTIAIIITFLAGYCHIFAQLTLEQCQQLARENYPLIKQFDLVEQAKEMTLSNATKAYLPQFSITGSANLINGLPQMPSPGTGDAQNTHNYKFVGIAQLSQVIWDGGATQAQRKIASASAETDKQNIEVLLYGIKERINQLYFGVLLLDEQLKQVDILDDNLAKNLKRAQTAQANGVAYRSDVDAIQVEILNAQQTRVNLNAQRNTYTKVLSIMIAKDITPETVFTIPTDKTVTLAQPINRPELQLYQQQRQLNNAQNNAITARIMPKIGLQGYAIGLTPSVSLGASKFNHLLMGGVSLSWNIGGLYTNKNDKNMIKTKNAMIDSQQETFLFNTNLQLTQTNAQVERSKQLLTKDDEIIRLRNNIKQATETKYENGACTVTDLVNDINAENLARQNKALHQIEYLMNVYSYQTTLGN